VFSADGSTVFFRSFRAGGGSGISRIPLAGGEPAIVTDAITGLPAISPDGTQIACFYRASPTTPLKLAILSTGGGSPVQLFDMPIPTTIAWMPDGKAVAYDGTLNGISNIFVQPLSGGEPVRLTNYSSGITYGFAWSPDGKELAIARGKITSDVVMISALP
jgi:TolB protein